MAFFLLPGQDCSRCSYLALPLVGGGGGRLPGAGLRLGSAGLRIPRPLPCPSLSSWNQSAHLLKEPLHQRSPGSCSPPGPTGRPGLYRIFGISDPCAWAVPLPRNQRPSAAQGRFHQALQGRGRKFSPPRVHSPAGARSEALLFSLTSTSL